jgi:mRNA-degrading endonuclease toxin of MazEF toxin-antitoxin module
MAKIIRTHVVIDGEEYLKDCGLRKQSKVMCENILAISKEQLKDRVGHLPTELKREVNEAIKIQLAISITTTFLRYTTLRKALVTIS